MSANWEFAVSQARGEYLMVIGDDDGLLPFALRELARLVERFERPNAVHWDPGYYYWPTIAARDAADYMILPLTRSVRRYSGREQLKRFARRGLDWSKLPTLYNSAVSRRLVEKHISIAGRMFLTSCPDVYSAYAFAYLSDTYVSSSVPMHLNGASGNSNGVASAIKLDQTQVANPRSASISREFSDLNEQAGFRRHPTVPRCEILQVHYDNSFQHAKDALFASDDDLALDRQEMMRSYLAGTLTDDPAALQEIYAAFRISLADRPDLLPWLEQELAKPRTVGAAVNPISKPKTLGFDGRYLLLDTKPFGISNIFEATQFASNLLQVGDGPIRYDVQSVAESAVRLGEAEQELVERTRRLEESEQELIDRTLMLEETNKVLAERTKQSQELYDLLVDRTARLEALTAQRNQTGTA